CLVDLAKRGALPCGQPGVLRDRIEHRAVVLIRAARLHPGLFVECVCGDLERLGDGVQHLLGGCPQAALDLREIRVRDPRERRELPHRVLGQLALLADDLAEGLGGTVRHTLRAYISCPPLTLSTVPVMNEEWSEARKCTARATSSGRPSRPTGICALIRSSTFSGTCSSISVAMKPGATALTVSPSESSLSFSALASAKHASRASVLVSPNSPDFDAA